MRSSYYGARCATGAARRQREDGLEEKLDSLLKKEKSHEHDLRKLKSARPRSIADSLARGDSASWCPMLNCGYDLHGEGQTGLDHPWHRLLYYALPLDVAFNLEMLASYVFGLAGMFVLLRAGD